VVANDATKVADESPAFPVDAEEEVMATLIILDRPDARHIPWFAMGVPLALEDRAADIDIEAGLDQNRIGFFCGDDATVRRYMMWPPRDIS
jgi:hypothetical protein